jgi:hypothetical protein
MVAPQLSRFEGCRRSRIRESLISYGTGRKWPRARETPKELPCKQRIVVHGCVRRAFLSNKLNDASDVAWSETVRRRLLLARSDVTRVYVNS